MFNVCKVTSHRPRMSWEMDISKLSARSAKVCKRGSCLPFSMLLMNGRPIPECTARSVWLHPRLSRNRRRRSPNLKDALIFTGRGRFPASEGGTRFFLAAALAFCTPPASTLEHHRCVALLLHEIFLINSPSAFKAQRSARKKAKTSGPLPAQAVGRATKLLVSIAWNSSTDCASCTSAYSHQILYLDPNKAAL